MALFAPGNSSAGVMSRSAPVTTATTPGDVSAAEVSIDVIVAWASGERTSVRCNAPVSHSSVRSSV